MEKCCDNYNTTFVSYPLILDYHQTQSENSRWIRCPVNELNVEALDVNSANYANPSVFAADVGEEAIKDTTEHLGLALRVQGELYPIRETAYKTLLDRAKIGGSILPKLKRKTLANVLNECLNLSKTEALVLIRDQKISAVHSGDKTDYSVLPIDGLLEKLTKKLDIRFPNSEFVQGYADHSMVSGLWKMPNQRKELLDAYIKVYPSYKDGENEYLAEATTSRVQMEEKPLISAREWAQTAAIGIALRNAGFGLQFAIAGEDFHDVAPNEIGTQTVVTEKPTKTETAKNVPAPVELTPEEKYKQALAIECPIKKFAGRTLGDVLLLEPGFIYWLAEKGDGKYKEAAKTICEQAKNQAA